MPYIAEFNGIRIKINYHDFGRHHLPHIHAEYQDSDAAYSIPDGECLAGKLPQRQHRLVKAWIDEHRVELLKEWSLAVAEKPLFKISHPIKKK